MGRWRGDGGLRLGLEVDLISRVSLSNKHHKRLLKYERVAMLLPRERPTLTVSLYSLRASSRAFLFSFSISLRPSQDRQADEYFHTYLLALRSGASERFHLSTQEKSFDVENLSHPV